MVREKNKKKSHSLGICERLFNFFNNLLVGSAGEHQPISSAKLGGVMNVQYAAHGNPTDTLASDIQVHFKQSDEELDSWTPVGKDDTIVHAEQPQLQKEEKTSSKKEIPLIQGNDISRGATSKSHVQGKTELSQLQGTQATESNFTNKAPWSDPNIMASLRNSLDEEEKNRKKGKKIPSENLTVATEDEVSQANTSSPSHFRLLLIATPHNINEISEKFINSRKEAMSNNI